MITKKPTHNYKSLFRRALLSLSALVLLSCTTEAFVSSDFDYSAENLQKAIQDNIPLGIGAVSPNGRGFYSKIFSQMQNKTKIPLVMRISILGDRRPYDIEIAVNRIDARNTKVDTAFENGETYVGQNSIAKRILTKINNQLAERLKDKNMFDDFRPY